MAKTSIEIAPGLTLSPDYVTQTAAILAQRRKGKTYTASVFAEELYGVGLPWVALDPTGAWWGLRSSADGLSAGLKVVVIGGQHGDLPLDMHAGAAVADLVLDHPGWYVLDLSLLEGRPAERRFATDFGARLHRRKMQPNMDFPMHLFVDEADLFVPQEKEAKGDVELLASYAGIVRRGGLHGLGTTLISQRPALVNKSVLTQLDLLVLLRLVAGNDQDAVDKNYVSRFADKAARAEIMDSLATLPVGEAWFLEPGAEPARIVRGRARERRTFNSSATPKVGQKRIEPKVFAQIDLAALREQMAETVERAKADDPKELQRQINALEVELRRARAERPTAEPEVVEVERVVEIVPPSIKHALEGARGVLEREAQRVAGALSTIGHEWDSAMEKIEHAQNGAARSAAGARLVRPRPALPTPAPRAAAAAPRPPAEGLSTGEQKILDALAWYSALGVDSPTRTQIAMIAGYSHKSGGYNNLISKLNTAGRVIAGRDRTVTLTDEGRALASDQGLPDTNEGVQEAVIARLDAPQEKLLRQIIARYPDPISRVELAELTGYTASSGGYNNLLSKLRSGALIEYGPDRTVYALDVLFPMNGSRA